MREVDLYIESNIKGRATKGQVMYILAYTSESGKTATTNKTLTFEDTTPHAARLKAINEAYGRLKSECGVRLWLDDDYIKKACDNGWIAKWKDNGWTNSKGKSVNEEWAQILVNITNHETRITAKARHPYKEWMERELKNQ